MLIRLRLGMGPAWGGWRDSPAWSGAGLLSDAGVHRLNLALFFFGPVRDVHAVLDLPRQRGETFAVAVLEFGSGALGIIEANHHGPRRTFDDEIEVVGSDAILRLGGIESLSFGYRSGAALSMFRDRQWTEVAVRADDWQASVQASVAAYLDAVTQRPGAASDRSRRARDHAVAVPDLRFRRDPTCIRVIGSQDPRRREVRNRHRRASRCGLSP